VRAQHARKKLARAVLSHRTMNEEQTTEDRGTDLEHDVTILAERARETIEQFVQEQPHAALGIAAAAGFVIGGGLTPRRLLRLGLASGGPVFSKQIFDQVLRFVTETLEQDHPASKRGGAKSAKNKSRE
jgi:ElaB/YqjD/DUF883 family membrane-anchored ribosome-binding protein